MVTSVAFCPGKNGRCSRIAKYLSAWLSSASCGPDTRQAIFHYLDRERASVSSTLHYKFCMTRISQQYMNQALLNVITISGVVSCGVARSAKLIRFCSMTGGTTTRRSGSFLDKPQAQFSQ